MTKRELKAAVLALLREHLDVAPGPWDKDYEECAEAVIKLVKSNKDTAGDVER